VAFPTDGPTSTLDQKSLMRLERTSLDERGEAPKLHRANPSHLICGPSAYNKAFGAVFGEQYRNVRGVR
jgi:hypothetical protein